VAVLWKLGPLHSEKPLERMSGRVFPEWSLEAYDFELLHGES